MEDITPVILAGGTGSRLWPLSRDLFPKQFHRLLGRDSLLQRTLSRAGAVSTNPPLVVCNHEHRFLVAEQCREAGIAWRQIILEPEGRNTAPAIALAALAAPGQVLLVLPADHLIDDVDGFAEAVARGVRAAREGALVTFGIRPCKPEVGYGYVRVGDEYSVEGVRVAAKFVEKPDAETAQAYLDDGRYLWNSGMFVLSSDRYMEELSLHRPAMVEPLREAMRSGVDDLDFFRPGNTFRDCPAESIDYAVMENTEHAVVVPSEFDWSDVGSWSAVWEASDLDDCGNHFSGDVIGVDTKDTYVLARDRLVGTLGVRNLAVVETSDAVLIAEHDRVQDVRQLVSRLKSGGRAEYRVHREVFRPWGSFESVGQGTRYQVKRIKVKPGERLSLQKHFHRAEHWIVVRGTAEVTRGDDTFTLSENESTYIPLGVQHRLGNPGKLDLELIEVQVGAYLGEDDIVRFDDVYGRDEEKTHDG